MKISESQQKIICMYIQSQSKQYNKAQLNFDTQIPIIVSASFASEMAPPGTFTFLMVLPLLLIILSSSEASADADACDLTIDGSLCSMRGWFWSSTSSTSCSQQSDCANNVECCHEGKCTWVDWVAPLIFTVILLIGLPVSFAIGYAISGFAFSYAFSFAIDY